MPIPTLPDTSCGVLRDDTARDAPPASRSVASRQHNRKSRAALRSALQRYAPPVLVDDALAEGEADAGAARLRGEEDLEDAREHLGRDRGAGVVEAAAPGAVGEQRRVQRDLAPLGRR